jgi:hypothetical protein
MRLAEPRNLVIRARDYRVRGLLRRANAPVHGAPPALTALTLLLLDVGAVASLSVLSASSSGLGRRSTPGGPYNPAGLHARIDVNTGFGWMAERLTSGIGPRHLEPATPDSS